MGLRGGLLDVRITFQTPTETRDAAGGISTSWATTFTDWADPIERTGNEKYMAMQKTGQRLVELTMRWREDVTLEMRFIWGSEFFEVRSINKIQREIGIKVLGELIPKT